MSSTVVVQQGPASVLTQLRPTVRIVASGNAGPQGATGPSGGSLGVALAPVAGTVTSVVDDGYMAPASTQLDTGSPRFAVGDVGKLIAIEGGGAAGAPLVTTIASYTSATRVVLTAGNASGLELSAVNFKFGVDNTTAFQTANTALVASTEKTLSFPTGEWLTTYLPPMTSDTTWQGQGVQSSKIHFVHATNSGIVGTDLSNITLRDFALYGTTRHPTASGINLAKSANPANFYVTIERVHVEGFFDGISIDTPIVSNLNRVVAFRNTRHGIHVFGTGDAAGTSIHLENCFTAGNYGAGYRLKQMAYCSLNACAADANGVSYLYDTCPGVTESGCGSEETYNFEALGLTTFLPSGVSRYIFNSKAVLNSPYMIGNVDRAIHVTNLSIVDINSMFEGSPSNDAVEFGSLPTSSLKVDAGCSVTVNEYSVVTPLDLATGTTVVAHDLNYDRDYDRVTLTTDAETSGLDENELLRLLWAHGSAKAAIAFGPDDAQSKVWLQAHEYLHDYVTVSGLAALVDTTNNRWTASALTKVGQLDPTATTFNWRTVEFVTLTTTGGAPGGLTAAATYYARLSGGFITMHPTAADATAGTNTIDITTQGTGTHTLTPDLTYANNYHKHFSIEVTDSTGTAKQSRFSIPYDQDVTEVAYTQANVTVHDAVSRIVAAAGSHRDLQFGGTPSSLFTPDGTNIRWAVRADNTTESGTNVGSDFRLVRYTDSGVATDSPLFIKRSSGRIGLAAQTSPVADLHVGGGANSTALVDRAATTNSASFQFGTAATVMWSWMLRNDSTNHIYLRDNVAARNLLVGRTTGQLEIDSGLAFNRTAVADTNYTILVTDTVVAVTSLTAPRTLTLPNAASVAITGQMFVIKDEAGGAATNNITVATTASQTIDGASTKTISTNFGYLQVISNGANWVVANTSAYSPSGGLAAANNLSDVASASTSRTNLGLGTAATTAAAAYATAAQGTTADAALAKASNLSDLTNAETARTNLGLTVGMVNHGAVDSVARPTGYTMVLWYGSVQPLNMIAPDVAFVS